MPNKFDTPDPEYDDDLAGLELGSILARRNTQPATEPQPTRADKSTAKTTDTTTPKMHTTAATNKRGRKPGRKPDATTPPTLVLWTPESIRARMAAHRANHGTYYLDQVFNALETTIDQLPDLLAAETAPRITGRLFDRTERSANTTEPRKQISIRGITASQLKTIDELADTTGANSRSHLVNTALNTYLPG